MTQSPNTVSFRQDIFIKSRFEISILKLKERVRAKMAVRRKIVSNMVQGSQMNDVISVIFIFCSHWL